MNVLAYVCICLHMLHTWRWRPWSVVLALVVLVCTHSLRLKLLEALGLYITRIDWEFKFTGKLVLGTVGKDITHWQFCGTSCIQCIEYDL